MLTLALIGNLGNDPELRFTADGKQTLRFNVACNGRTRTPEGEYVGSRHTCTRASGSTATGGCSHGPGSTRPGRPRVAWRSWPTRSSS
jgi:single-stranded DNA-binding protein